MYTLLGDEAVALGALHAGLSAAYGYPGTPSTEILEYLMAAPGQHRASWCSNEKTALETALGTSFAGQRSLVTMKHVGLNVAADPFINGALLSIRGGLVVAVADDPGMHSSQNEQDSRFYAAFALIPCLEPRNQQEAYDMTREAFSISERFHIPVLLRLVTRLSHARATVIDSPPIPPHGCSKPEGKFGWVILPAYARQYYDSLIEKQKALNEWAAHCAVNRLEKKDPHSVVITSGLGGNYYEENLADLIRVRAEPSRLHIGAYPVPSVLIRELCAEAQEVLVIEEGQPFIEERLRGILTQQISIRGKLDGTVKRSGELDPDIVRSALGLSPHPRTKPPALNIPNRPAQLCQGCPHGDSFDTIKKAIADYEPSTVVCTSDIGCYSLGVLPPYAIPESIVCMGASVGMARGAAEAGIQYAVAIIGDSTFLHSGITALLDTVAQQTPITIIILDNSAVAMTGCQDTIIPSEKLRSLIVGAGVEPDHCIELAAKRQLIDENALRLKAELAYRGVSVILFKRECLEALRRRRM
ncbi:MAG: indolepyruvate ferredoxin oxidoreductase [Treponema sp.]|jgi:indolepyruvate ferredoxin oxidoreductase alpha subunit|nr:indolepyruvate ferredoxin oxidoreductase [Treponema sp.]